MDFIVLLLVLIVIGLGVTIFLLLKRKPEKPSESLLMLQQQISDLGRALNNGLSESNKVIQTQFGQSAKIIRNVTEKLTRLDETNRQVVSFADQLRNLQDILKNQRSSQVKDELDHQYIH